MRKFFRDIFSVCLVFLGGFALAGPVVVPVSSASNSAERARTEASRVAAAAASVGQGGSPCFYQVPGVMQLVNLSLLRDFRVGELRGDGTRMIHFIFQVGAVELRVADEQAHRVFRDLQAPGRCSPRSTGL